jgi:hypothetical protein
MRDLLDRLRTRLALVIAPWLAYEPEDDTATIVFTPSPHTTVGSYEIHWKDTA